VGARDDSWHAMVQEGLTQAGAVIAEMPTGPGLRLEMGSWLGAVADPPAADRPGELPRSDWPAVVVAGPPAAARSPSDLGGAKVLPGEVDEGAGDVARARGRLVHALLEHLPDLPSQDRDSAAQSLAASVEGADLLTDTADIIAGVTALLDSPTRRHLFVTGRAEVALSATVPDLHNARLTGSIDRLIVADDGVTAIDYKTNRLVPDDPTQVPEGILRQMGAYHAMLEQVYPGRDIRLAILWLTTGALMGLSVQECRAALRRAAG
jgi:ATP-dependent helicase/nuclease subunit A